jgi:hypothetical protein
MLVRLYFPELQTHWTNILRVRDKANSALTPFKLSYRANGPLPAHAQYMKPLKQALDELEIAQEAFKIKTNHAADTVRNTYPVRKLLSR